MPTRPRTFAPKRLSAPRHELKPKARDNQKPRTLHTGTKAWRLMREQVLTRDRYTCRICQRIVTGVEAHVDHVDGDYSNNLLSNLQVLCRKCHGLKTVGEQQGAKAASHPHWLPKPACEVELISGPPGSGKTTLARQKAGRDDVVIDLDDCFQIACGVHGHEADSAYLPQAIRIRNAMLARLEGKRVGKAYVIVSAPTTAEAQWWVDLLGARHTRLTVSESECTARLATNRKHLARAWYAKAAQPWKMPRHLRT